MDICYSEATMREIPQIAGFSLSPAKNPWDVDANQVAERLRRGGISLESIDEVRYLVSEDPGVMALDKAHLRRRIWNVEDKLGFGSIRVGRLHVPERRVSEKVSYGLPLEEGKQRMALAYQGKELDLRILKGEVRQGHLQDSSGITAVYAIRGKREDRLEIERGVVDAVMELYSVPESVWMRVLG